MISNNAADQTAPTGIIFGSAVIIGGCGPSYCSGAVDQTRSIICRICNVQGDGYPQTFFLGLCSERPLDSGCLGFVPGVIVGTRLLVG